MTTVLFLGATGYIGGSVLVSLIKEYPSFAFKALVRSESAFPAIKGVGAVPIKGSFADTDLITNLVAEVDIVVNAADSDDVKLNTAILDGFKKRKEEGKPMGALIHISGAAIFLDGAKGSFDPNAKVWTDLEDDVKQYTPAMLHGQVDVPILKASEEGYVNSFIICPSGVMGLGSGPVKKASSFFPKTYVQKKEAFYVGEGTNIFQFVHINDLVDLFEIIFKHAVEAAGKPLSSSPYTRYYIASTTTWDWKTVSSWYAPYLHKRGLVKSPVPTSVAYEEAGPFAIVFGGNMSFKPQNARKLGWEAKHTVTKEHLVEGLDEEL